MIKDILKSPDLRLLEVCKDSKLSGKAIKQVKQDLLDTLAYANHPDRTLWALAASQIGYAERIAVFHAPEYRGFMTNPVIVIAKGERISMEGCASEGEKSTKIARFKIIKVKCDEGTMKFCDFTSTIIQHEIDHMNGILIAHRGMLPLTPILDVRALTEGLKVDFNQLREENKPK